MFDKDVDLEAMPTSIFLNDDDDDESVYSRTAPPARAPMADRLSVWLVRDSVTSVSVDLEFPARQLNCGIQLLAETVLDNL